MHSFLGPFTFTEFSDPMSTQEEFMSSTGGQKVPYPCSGPSPLPAAGTEERCVQLKPSAYRVGWEEQDLPCPSQTRFKPQLPGFDSSPTRSDIMCLSTFLHVATDCVASRASSKTRCHPGHVAQLEHCPLHQKAAGSIPCQGTNSGCRFGPKLGHVREVTNQPIDVSLSLPLSKKIN